MKRRLLQIGCICLACMCLPLGALGEKPTYSVMEVAEQAQGGWHQTYDAHGRMITVDCPVTVPEVTEMPVLQVRWRTTPFVLGNAPAGAEVDSGERGFAFIKNDPRNSLLTARGGQEWTAYEEPWDMNEAYAYNNPLTLGEAVEYAIKTITACGGGSLTLELSRFYSTLNRKIDHSTGDFLEMIDDRGYYTLHFYQMMQGVPILGNVGITAHTTVDGGIGFPSPHAEIASPDEYTMGGSFMEETSILYEDVPLCSFERVKEAFESKILSGNVREVESVRLGYILYIDPQDTSLGRTVPVWIMRCKYMETAKEEDAFPLGKNVLQYGGYYGQLIVNAQTGEMIEPWTSDSNVERCPAIHTWQ